MAKIRLQSRIMGGLDATGVSTPTAVSPTCELCPHRKVWCGRWRWRSSRSWHSWWTLFRPVRPRARWGWSERRRWATWRRTLHRAPADRGLLSRGDVRTNMSEWGRLTRTISCTLFVISNWMAAGLFFYLITQHDLRNSLFLCQLCRIIRLLIEGRGYYVNCIRPYGFDLKLQYMDMYLIILLKIWNSDQHDEALLMVFY